MTSERGRTVENIHDGLFASFPILHRQLLSLLVCSLLLAWAQVYEQARRDRCCGDLLVRCDPDAGGLGLPSPRSAAVPPRFLGRRSGSKALLGTRAAKVSCELLLTHGGNLYHLPRFRISPLHLLLPEVLVAPLSPFCFNPLLLFGHTGPN